MFLRVIPLILASLAGGQRYAFHQQFEQFQQRASYNFFDKLAVFFFLYNPIYAKQNKTGCLN